MLLDGKVAIVTGSTSGIGQAIAGLFLEQGAHVIGVGRRSHEGFSDHGRFVEVRADLSDLENAPKIVETAQAHFGKLDILVNNAGIGNARSLLDTTDEDVERYLLVNYRAPFALCRAAVAAMLDRGGTIVNVASNYGLVGIAGSSGYAPTKAALINLTKSMAADYGGRGIRTNAVAPGTVRTPLTEERLRDPWNRNIWMGTNPVGRPAEAREVAEAVLFLASDQAGVINGVVLPVDGGWAGTKVPPKPSA